MFRRLLNRRRCLKSATAFAASAPFRASATTGPTPVAGAIRWDAWYDSQHREAVEAALGPAQWHFRAPWFSKEIASDALSINGNYQSVIDYELALAADAGLRYWAYVWYGESHHMQNAWLLHQASSLKNRMSWCLLWQFSDLGNPSTFRHRIPDYLSYFEQGNYQVVLGERPLVFLDIDGLTTLTANWSAAWVNVFDALQDLRAACRQANIGNPYLVIMYGDPRTAASIMANVQADAISNYVGRIPHGRAAGYAELDKSVRNYWAEQAATGSAVVPIAMMGWDRRPRAQHPPPWESSTSSQPISYVSQGTETERAAHLHSAVDFMAKNRSVCPSRALLIYSWNECDEGGGVLCPTLGDPPPGRMLSAIRPVLAKALP